MQRVSGLMLRGLLSGALAFLLIPMIGCSAGKAEESGPGIGGGKTITAHEPPHGKLLMILLDETASFGGVPDLWTASVQKAASEVKEMNAGDSCMVIAITDKGWRSQDVLIPYTTLTTVPLMVMRDRNDLVNRIRNLKVRSTSSGFLVNGKPTFQPKGTDLLGAVDYAAFQTKSSEKRAVSIVVFTDLEDKPIVATAGKTLQTWPFWSHLFVVNARADQNADITQTRIANWLQIFNSMKHPEGADVTSKADCYMIGESDKLQSVFGWTRH